MTPIRPIDLPAAVERTGAARERGAVSGQGGTSFASTLSDAISQARATDEAASTAAAGFAAGDPAVGIHEVMIATEKANVSLRYATTLKNKLLDLHKEPAP